jgi:hypothetical protein
MAESDCGVACQRNMNNVGRKMLGCFTEFQSCMMRSLEFSISSEPETESEIERSPKGNRSSFTRTATADVISGNKAVTPKTNLH